MYNFMDKIKITSLIKRVLLWLVEYNTSLSFTQCCIWSVNVLNKNVFATTTVHLSILNESTGQVATCFEDLPVLAFPFPHLWWEYFQPMSVLSNQCWWRFIFSKSGSFVPDCFSANFQEKGEKQVWNRRRQILYTVEKVGIRAPHILKTS